MAAPDPGGEPAVLGGRYELREPIGSGGMAAVWLATDRRLGREVAVKLLDPGLAADADFLARFRREARIAASLTHPNLVGVFDFDAGPERPYLVMELVEGPDLGERLDARDAPPTERLAADLLAALDAIHRAGVVHRDVKPQNVLLAPEGRALLTDFGVARPQDATSITQTGQMPGTGPYMAPELMEGHAATPASDLYALGVLLRECPPSPPGSRLQRLVERLRSPEPSGRPASAAAALDELLGPRPGKAKPPPSPAPVAAADTRPPAPTGGREIHIDRSRLLTVGAIGLVAGLVALVIALAGGGEEPGEGAGAEGPRDERRAQSSKEDGSEEPSAGRESASEPDPARGTALNQEGYSMLQSGDAEGAVPVLQEAVESFPEGTDDLNYAYALFNLGQALREAGRSEEAIPILERRLRIPNQRGVVRKALEDAREEAG